MRIQLHWLFMFLLFLGCKEIQKSPSLVYDKEVEVKYAEGFTIELGEGYKILTLTNPWPGADKSFRYLLKEGSTASKSLDYDSEIFEGWDEELTIPVESIVVTSTTHIPSLDMLGLTDRISGFPGLDYISSETARNLIESGKIQEVGQNESLNTEVLIDMNPDVVVGFAVSGANTAYSSLDNAGIPVIYNSDWTETHPLGKAEWIKFFGVLFGKEKEADSIFKEIEANYNLAKQVASKAKVRPTVLSGAMYKDIWYMPQGNSWAARFIDDANGNYLWGDTEGTGSLSMNLEAVLEEGMDADFWIGPGQFTSIQQFNESHSAYSQFKSLEEGNVYSFTTKKGPTGGVLYYELAPNRPDIVLKDIIAILHPDLLPDHELYFFSKVE